MAISSAEQFFALLERSRLLSPAQLKEARQSVEGNGLDPTGLARALVDRNLLSRWQAGQLLAGRSAFFLGKYKLIELLGQGGMGSVFLAEHMTMNRRVALKVLSRQLGKEPEALQRFLAEARAAAALDHQNIVHAYNVDCEGDRYYLVMEYVDGVDLLRLVQDEGRLEDARAADFVRQAAEGLAHAHSQHMVHCDIKPSNLLVNSHGVVKILDMGLARVLEEGGSSKKPEERILGSVDYMAPEQAMGGAEFDHRADIYSLGCTLYFLLTGHPPFPEGSLPEKLMKHQTEDPADIMAQRADVPLELVHICERMMAKDPVDRYQSAEEVITALSRLEFSSRKLKQAAPTRRVRDSVAADDAGLESIPLLMELELASAEAAQVHQSGEMQIPSAALAQHAAVEPGLLSTPAGKLAIAAIVGVTLIAIGTVIVLSTQGSGSPRAGLPPPTTSRLNDRPGGAPPPVPDAGKKAKLPEEGKSPQAGSKQKGEGKDGDGKAGSTVKKKGKGPKKGGKGGQTPDPVTPPANGDGAARPDQVAPPPEVAVTPPPEITPEPTPIEPAPVEPPPPATAPKAVDLPSIPTDEAKGTWVTLASLGRFAGAPLTISLEGGENALKGDYQFGVRPESADGNWTFVSSQKGGVGTLTPVAALRVEGGELMFQWLPTAARERASHLRNCGLTIAGGGETHFLALTTAKAAPPLILNTARGGVRAKLPLDTPPEPSVLRVQLTALPDWWQTAPDDTASIKVHVDSNEAIAVRTLTLLEQPSNKLFVRFSMEAEARELTLTAATLLLGDSPPPRPVQLSDASEGMQQLTKKVRQLEGAAKSSDPRKRKTAEDQLQRFQELLAQVEAVYGALQRANGAAAIQYRIFVAAGMHEVELFNSELAGGSPGGVLEATPDEPVPEKPAKKSAKKGRKKKS
ncbi:MAG: serine/threonine protein kinase [Planctomycetota bacterium]